MFLLRMMFWLAVVIMLIPSEGGEQTTATSTADHELSVGGAMGAAAATVSDIAGFCDRNREVCETGSVAFDAFLAKAENAARMAYRMAAGARGVTPVDEPVAEMNARDAEYRSDAFSSEQPPDTLNARDLEPAWRGPGAAEI